MSDLVETNTKKNKVIPYKIVVQYENSLRDNAEFWRFRSATNVLRQTKQQIEAYCKRYAKE